MNILYSDDEINMQKGVNDAAELFSLIAPRLDVEL